MSLKDDWDSFDKKTKIGIGGALGVAIFWGVFGSMINKPAAEATPQRPPAATNPNVPAAGAQSADAFNARVLPETPRNQGLETLKVDIDSMRSDLLEMRRALGLDARNNVAPQRAAFAASAATVASTPGYTPPLDSPLPPPGPVDARALLGNDGKSPAPLNGNGVRSSGSEPAGSSDAEPATTRKQLRVWEEDATPTSASKSVDAAVVIPANSALEGVLLSGFNARPSGAITAAVGSVNSANSVGAPFVSRIKGDAILPNSWKIADLGDCFLGGSATAVLSAERAYSIAKSVSCINVAGEVFEGQLKAFGLDVDGTLGLACKVVSKQGSLIAQAALTGVVSGIGTALTPQQLPSYVSNASGGGQAAYQLPNPRMLAETAVGQGVEKAASQVSKFYLDYAKEVFPVCEVTSGTRITWILEEPLELKRRGLTERPARPTVATAFTSG